MAQQNFISSTLFMVSFRGRVVRRVNNYDPKRAKSWNFYLIFGNFGTSSVIDVIWPFLELNTEVQFFFSFKGQKLAFF